jgi:hypothetical protein
MLRDRAPAERLVLQGVATSKCLDDLLSYLHPTNDASGGSAVLPSVDAAIDIAELVPVLEHLRNLLIEADAESIQVFESHRALFREAVASSFLCLAL